MMNLRIFAATLGLLVILTIQGSKASTGTEIFNDFDYVTKTYFTVYNDDGKKNFDLNIDFNDCMEKHSSSDENEVKKCVIETLKNTASQVKQHFDKDYLESALRGYCSMFQGIHDKNKIPLLNELEKEWGVTLPDKHINQNTYT